MFYKVDSSRVTLREYWWDTKLLIGFAAILKVFRVQLRGSTDDLAVQSLRPFRVDASSVAPDVRERFVKTLNELTTLGFGSPIWHAAEDFHQATRNTLATLLHRDGRTMARVQCRINLGTVPARVKFFTLFVSRIPDGFIVTGTGKRDLAWPANHDTIRRRELNTEEVWALHRQRMTARVETTSPDAVEQLAEEYHASLRDFHLARGVFRPLSDEETARFPSPPPADALVATRLPTPLGILDVPGPMQTAFGPPALPVPAPQSAPADLMEIVVMDELRQMRNKKVNWRSSVGLFVLSAAAFVYFWREDDGSHDWEYIGIIVGVLLFHELGHFLAMKAFGYRNLRMFFIPGFGAAVSGRHYNAAAWKKIIVSLMGPLPGIVVGVVLLISSKAFNADLPYKIGLLSIILNAMNLIPILPLDGGWVAHAALFSRHPKLDVGFRLIAVLALFAAAWWVPGAGLLTYLAIFGLLSLPVANKIAVIVKELRKLPELGVSPDNLSIPEPAARTILAKVRERFTRQLTPRVAAQHVTNIFESLNARPPSIGATIGLLSLHAAGFAVAIGGAVLIVGLHVPSLRTRPEIQGLKYEMTLDQVERRGERWTSPHNSVVISFKSEAAARAALVGVEGARPAGRFGQTVFVSFLTDEVAKQRAFYAKHEKAADDIFVESKVIHANLMLAFHKPPGDAGKRLFDDLNLYFFNLPAMEISPPWATGIDWPNDRRAEQTRLRRLLVALQSLPNDTYLPIRKSNQKIDLAERSGDMAEADRLRAESKKAVDEAIAAYRAKVQSEYGHADFIAKWLEIDQLDDRKEKSERLNADIAPLLGKWPAGRPADVLAQRGTVYETSPGMLVLYCQFVDTEAGLEAMRAWLSSNGVKDIRYEIHGYPTVEFAMPED